MDYSKNKRHPRLLTLPDSSMVFGKVPPQAIDLEQAVIGAVMIDRSAFDLVSDLLKPECFYKEDHQNIYKSFLSLQIKRSPIDMLTVINELKSTGELDDIGGPAAISRLTNNVSSSINIEAHAKIVYQKFIQREIIRISGELINEAYEDGADAFDLLDLAEKSINNISIGANTGMIRMDAVLMQTVKKIDEWRQNDDAITGIPSGFNDLDQVTRGWQNGDLIVIGARPSVGKTAFALNIARHAALNDKKKVSLAFWSLEMKAIFLALRMIAAESKIYLYRLLTGRLSDDEMAYLMRTAVNVLSKANIYFDESSDVTISQLCRKARKLKRKNNLGMIIVDYLQLMKGEEKKNSNREQDISGISRSLKNLATELDVPLIALSQLSREAAAKNINWESGPPLGALRESGAIEQDADVVILEWEPSDDDIAKNPQIINRRKVRIVKQRNGLKKTFEYNFESEIQLFSEIISVTGTKLKPVVSIEKGYRSYDADDETPF